MEEDEEFKTKENQKDSSKNLPDINAKKNDQFYQLDDLRSDEAEKNKDGSVKGSSNKHINGLGKTKANNMINTSDKLKDIDDVASHKNGTVSGSDHKMFGKQTGTKFHNDNRDTPNSQDKSIVHPDNEDAKSENDGAQNEILHKERKTCPK